MDRRAIRGGFILAELIAASITTIDVVAVYAFLQVKRGKFRLALLTAILNMFFPFLGFLTGEFSANIFAGWSTLLSGLLLGLIGLHMILHNGDSESPVGKIHPSFIAVAVSIDAFSVSVSFGMLQMDRMLFITASGFFTLVLSYVALRFKGRLGMKDGKSLRRFAGLALLIMGIVSCIQ